MPLRPDPAATAALIAQAIDVVGSQAALGRATGRSQNAVWHALKVGRVTAEFAADIDRATHGRIPKTRLRPDVFGEAA